MEEKLEMSDSSLDVLFKIIAKNPPSIAIAGGILIILLAGFVGNDQLVDTGLIIVVIGALLQVGWLLQNYYSRKG